MALASTAAVQQTLSLAGFWDGPIDGEWTPALTEALKDFQTALGVEPTGTVDAATVTALEDAIAAAQEPEPTPSETPSEGVERGTERGADADGEQSRLPSSGLSRRRRAALRA